MKAWKIFRHSVGMVQRNFVDALKIAIVPWFLAIVAIVVLFLTTGLTLETAFDDAQFEQFMEEQPGRVLSAMFGMLFVTILVNFWIVVNWHRFVLLEEYPQGWIPRFRMDRILAYFGRALLLGLMVAVVVLVFVSAATSVFFSSGSFLVGGLLGVFGVLLGIFLLYRFVPILPAAAVGKPVGFGAAWVATKGSSGTIVLLTIVMFMFNVCVGLFAQFLLLVPILGLLIALLVNFVVWLVNMSVLTTFYGHYVEDRPI